MARRRNSLPPNLRDNVARGSAVLRLEAITGSAYADPDNTGHERLVRQVGVDMQGRRNAGVVADAAKMSRVLNGLVRRILTNNGIADNKKIFDMTLVNLAATRLSDGTLFRYFDAVDRGRGAVLPKNARKLVFIVKAGGSVNDNNRDFEIDGGVARIIGSYGVRGTKPAYITVKALAETQTKIPQEVEKQLRKMVRNIKNYSDTGKLVYEEFREKYGNEFTIDNFRVEGSVSRYADSFTRNVRDRYRRRRDKETREAGTGSNKGDHAHGQSPGQQQIADAIQSGQTVKGLFDYKPHNFSVVPEVIIRMPEIKAGGKVDEAYIQQEIEDLAGGLESKIRGLPYDSVVEILAREGLNITARTEDEILEEIDRFAEAHGEELRKELSDITSEEKAMRAKYDAALRAGQGAAQQVFGFFRQLSYGPSRAGGRILEVTSTDPNRGPSQSSFKAAVDRENFNKFRAAAMTSLHRFTTAEEIVAYFMRSVKPSIQIFKKHTPRRKGYKLLSDGTYLPPSKKVQDDVLRNSWQYIAGGEVVELVRKYKSQ
jgi:hypothetical protein